MLLAAVKDILLTIGIDPKQLYSRLGIWSLTRAAKEQNLLITLEQLRTVLPDISNQESRKSKESDSYSEIKRRLFIPTRSGQWQEFWMP